MTALRFDPALDLFPLAAALLAALSCGLLGNFLVLRRQSLMGDAISHAVLPGLVIAFLLTSVRSPLVMFTGAAIAAVATVVLIELVKRLGRVEPGAAMGVVFSVMFALGVLLIEKAAARQTDLDAECVLHGQLEMLAWYGAPETLGGLWSAETLRAVPRQVWVLLASLAAGGLFVGLLFKELRLAAFDPQLATAQGFPAGALHHALMVLVAVATVASFEAVGSILVIAMLVCPAATARLVTDRLGTQLAASLVFATLAALLGYAGASALPALLAGGADSVNAAGSITVASGALLAATLVLAPREGVVARIRRRRRLARRVATDDVLAALFRRRERGATPGAGAGAPIGELARLLPGRSVGSGIRAAARRGLVSRDGDRVALTPAGDAAARDVVRRHRLWEDYLVRRAGMAPDHVHDPAEQLEHLGLAPGGDGSELPPRDPHGSAIPPRRASDPGAAPR